MSVNHEYLASSHREENFAAGKILLLGSLALAAIMLFLSLIAVEILALSLIEGAFANSIIFPAYEFKEIANTIWSLNPWSTLQQWSAQPVFKITHYDEMSGLSVWAVYYYLPGIISNLIVALASVLYFYKLSSNSVSPNALVLMVIAALFLITPTFYISIAEHCAGANWMINVMLRAWQSDIGNVTAILEQSAVNINAIYLLCQWTLVTAGISTYIILFYRLGKAHK
jgi:hypothetical protein